MNYNVKFDNKDFSKIFEIFCAKHQKECVDFLKSDKFYLKIDTDYSDDFNQKLHDYRMTLNDSLRTEYDKRYPTTNSSNYQEGLSRNMDFELFKKSTIDYLASTNSAYKSIQSIAAYDPQIDPINMRKDKETGEYIVKSVGKNFNPITTQNSVNQFLSSHSIQEEVISKKNTLQPK